MHIHFVVIHTMKTITGCLYINILFQTVDDVQNLSNLKPCFHICETSLTHLANAKLHGLRPSAMGLFAGIASLAGDSLDRRLSGYDGSVDPFEGIPLARELAARS